MANARHRHRLWHRAGPAAALTMGTLLVAAAASGCDDGSESTTTTTSSTNNTTSSTGGGGAGGTGGAGSTGTPELKKVAEAATVLDSTPDSTGDNIYYVAQLDGSPAVLGVAADGTVTNVFVGDPLGGPVGISISTDDKTLYVADAAYDVTADDPNSLRGALLKMGTSADSTPSVMAGTAGYRPRGIDVLEDPSGDIVFFTGVDPSTGEAGLFSIPAAGGAVSKVATGAPFEDPSGVAVGKEKIYVTDTLASDQRFSSVIVVEGGSAKTYLPKVRVGYPAGVALGMDEKTLYVSGIDDVTETDVVLVIDLASDAVTPFSNDILKANTDAGGLHRARKSDVFSWADLTAGALGGAVYKVTFK